jgi:16S rRNA (guanine527-N7)-methyltransferase
VTYDDAGSGRRTARRHDRQEGCLDRPPDPLPTRVNALPNLPATYHDALDAGLAAIRVELSPEARTTIDDHVRLLLAWNASINLTAIRDPRAIAIRHVVDSLTGLRVLGEMGVTRILDLGSGAGFPGLPLVVALPRATAVLVESVAKKARFLETVVEATGLGDFVRVETARAEDLVRRGGARRESTVVARAVAPLAELIELALPLAGPGGRLIAWKRASAVAEGADGELPGARRALEAISPGGTMHVEAALPVGAGEAVRDLREHRFAVVVAGPDPIGERWPRDPAVRRRAPW